MIEGEFLVDDPIRTCTVTRSDGMAKKVDFEREYVDKDKSMEVMVCRWVKFEE